MKITKNKQTNRDIVLSILLFIIAGIAYVFIQILSTESDATKAHIYYGNLSTPIVTIDFAHNNGEGRIIVNYNQEVRSQYGNYPIISEEKQTITLLGDYEIEGIRQIVVIKYDYTKKSVEIIEEQSPNNICSREGESRGKPLICLPNRIRVEFETSEDVDFTI